LNGLPELLRYDGSVVAIMKLAMVHELADIDRILEQMSEGSTMEASATASAAHLRAIPIPLQFFGKKSS
jgi:hypothetical protein